MMLEHAPWFLGAWVFCNQAGIPVPVIPALIGVGALAADSCGPASPARAGRSQRVPAGPPGGRPRRECARVDRR